MWPKVLVAPVLLAAVAVTVLVGLLLTIFGAVRIVHGVARLGLGPARRAQYTPGKIL